MKLFFCDNTFTLRFSLDERLSVFESVPFTLFCKITNIKIEIQSKYISTVQRFNGSTVPTYFNMNNDLTFNAFNRAIQKSASLPALFAFVKPKRFSDNTLLSD